jgi:hypothetical protein
MCYLQWSQAAKTKARAELPSLSYTSELTWGLLKILRPSPFIAIVGRRVQVSVMSILNL